MKNLLVFAFCLSLQSQTTSDEAKIRAARQTSNSAIQHHDIKTYAQSLDSDYIMVRGNGVLVPSREASIAIFTEDFANPNSIRYERTPDKIEISQAAPLASEYGHWLGTRQNGSSAYGGTYLAMWRRTGATWKLRSELFVVLHCDDAPACAAYRKP